MEVVSIQQTGVHGNTYIKSWTPDLQTDELLLQQATNAATLPFTEAFCLMPDGHPGFGVPIGSMLATRGYVVPNAIGVDIGCGMNARRTNIEADSIRSDVTKILQQIKRDVPTGNQYGSHKTGQEVPTSLVYAYSHAPEASFTTTDFYTKIGTQLGTLGGGNHFIELQEDEEGYVWIMLHSGSRAVGQKICTHYNDIAKEINRKYFSVVPKSADLAFLPLDSEDGRDYIQWMRFGAAFATANRDRMMDRAIDALFKVAVGTAPDESFLVTEYIDTHHNIADMEHHHGIDVLVTRKGAVRARAGERVIIPGSMETGSYIAEGLGNEESYLTCSHGAGRKMSRTKARAARTVEDMVLSLRDKNIALVTNYPSEVIDEAGHAYKNVDDIMAQSVDLVKPLFKLSPMGVLKGSDPARKGKRHYGQE